VLTLGSVESAWGSRAEHAPSSLGPFDDGMDVKDRWEMRN
jgi:hypothetical protein